MTDRLARRFFPPPSSLLLRRHLQQVQSAAVGTQHLEGQVVDAYLLAAFGHAAEPRYDEPADGLVILVAQVRAERRIEIGDLGERLDPVLAAPALYDIVFD